jgi:hypothetical protein
MIRTSQLAGIIAEVDTARRLRAQLAQVRASDPGSVLAITESVVAEGATPLGISLPAGMVADGLLQQLQAAAARLALHGIHFDEAERASDIPPPPKRIRRKKDAAA